jgi:site-specific recombinase XerD
LTSIAPIIQRRHQHQLAAIPEEGVWLESQKSACTRRAYKLDVAYFMRTLGIATPEMLRQLDHRAVIAWGRIMLEQEQVAPSTVRHRLAALSSLFKRLVRHGVANRNPVVDVQRPAINREEGSTLTFSKAQARKILDAPPADTIAGLRDRALLSVGLRPEFVGRRSRRSMSATSTRTEALPRCTSCARADTAPLLR